MPQNVFVRLIQFSCSTFLSHILGLQELNLHLVFFLKWKIKLERIDQNRDQMHKLTIVQGETVLDCIIVVLMFGTSSYVLECSPFNNDPSNGPFFEYEKQDKLKTYGNFRIRYDTDQMLLEVHIKYQRKLSSCESCEWHFFLSLVESIIGWMRTHQAV